MKQVKSKYQNPDKYIEKLKKQVDEARASSKQRHGKMGVEVFTYINTALYKNTVISGLSGEFCVGDTVVIVGNVKRVVRDRGGRKIEYDNITVCRKESR